jgi:hypothetical protein
VTGNGSLGVKNGSAYSTENFYFRIVSCMFDNLVRILLSPDDWIIANQVKCSLVAENDFAQKQLVLFKAFQSIGTKSLRHDRYAAFESCTAGNTIAYAALSTLSCMRDTTKFIACPPCEEAEKRRNNTFHGLVTWLSAQILLLSTNATSFSK